MNKIQKLLIGLGLIALGASPAGAVRLDFDPALSTGLMLNDVLTLDLVVSELGNGGAPSLGAFDVDVLYDAAVLSFQSAAFGADLGDPGLFQALTILDGSTAGVVDLAEISLLAPGVLDAIQTDSVVIASLDFRVVGNGTSALSFDGVVLSDAFGTALDVEAGSGVARAVPEPGAALVFLMGSLLVMRTGRGRR